FLAALRALTRLIPCRSQPRGVRVRMRDLDPGRTISRRSLLGLMPAALGVLVACTAAPSQPAPTAAPKAAPTLAATPAAAQAPKPTAPPPAAPTAAPAAPKPTEAPKPTAAAAAKPGIMRPLEGPPKRGGILKIAGGTVTTPHFDLHQGATAHPLTQI